VRPWPPEALRKVDSDALPAHHISEGVEATEANWVEDWGAEVRRKFGEVEATLAIKHSHACRGGGICRSCTVMRGNQ